jgi:hypothetical protein
MHLGFVILRPQAGFSCLGFNDLGREWFGRHSSVGQKKWAAAKVLMWRSGTDGRMSAGREKSALALGALLLSALALGGCSISIADLPLVGTPADAPARAKETGAYLPVNELPPARDEAAMDPAERAKIQSELVAARERQASAAAAKDSAAK